MSVSPWSAPLDLWKSLLPPPLGKPWSFLLTTHPRKTSPCLSGLHRSIPLLTTPPGTFCTLTSLAVIPMKILLPGNYSSLFGEWSSTPIVYTPPSPCLMNQDPSLLIYPWNICTFANLWDSLDPPPLWHTWGILTPPCGWWAYIHLLFLTRFPSWNICSNARQYYSSRRENWYSVD